MNYGEVKNLFIGILNNRKLTPSQAIQFIDEGIARCQRQLRIPAMEKALDVTIGANFNGLYIPSDYLKLIRIEDSAGEKLIQKPLDYIRAYNYTGPPQFYARQVNKWVLGPIPAEGDTVRIDYYAEFDGLENDEDDNILTVIAPTLPVYAALSLAADFFSDVRAPAFEARYTQLLNQLNDQATSDETVDASVSQAVEYPDDW